MRRRHGLYGSSSLVRRIIIAIWFNIHDDEVRSTETIYLERGGGSAVEFEMCKS